MSMIEEQWHGLWHIAHMSLGSNQIKAATEAATKCARAIKRLTTPAIKRALVQAVRMQRPELAMEQITRIAIKASVASKFSIANGRSLQQLQSYYQRFMAALQRSRSEKHQKEMLRLFWNTYDQ